MLEFDVLYLRWFRSLTDEELANLPILPIPTRGEMMARDMPKPQPTHSELAELARLAQNLKKHSITLARLMDYAAITGSDEERDSYLHRAWHSHILPARRIVRTLSDAFMIVRGEASPREEASD